jgi:hypothetical protein
LIGRWQLDGRTARGKLVMQAIHIGTPPTEMRPSFRLAPACRIGDAATRHPERRRGSMGQASSHPAGTRTFSEIQGLCSNSLRLWQNPKPQ